MRPSVVRLVGCAALLAAMPTVIHHCAELQITPDPAKPIDKQWPAERER